MKRPCFNRYLDAAMFHALRELATVLDEKESAQMLVARNLRAQCYLNMSRFTDAQQEAENVLKWDKRNGTAMFVRAEALYLQCKVRDELVYSVFAVW